MAARPSTWLSANEQDAWRSFLRAHAVLLGRLNRDLVERTGLSIADYEVLVHLSEAAGGRLRQWQLGAAMQWEKSRLSHHLTRMAGRGLIRREDCRTDARGAEVVITRAGRRAIEAAAPLHVEQVRRWFVDPLGATNLARLAEISGRLLDAVEAE